MSSRAEKVFEQRKIDDEGVAHITSIKTKAADLWDALEGIHGTAETISSEQARLVSIAKTTLEVSVMWAVKAVSRK